MSTPVSCTAFQESLVPLRPESTGPCYHQETVLSHTFQAFWLLEHTTDLQGSASSSGGKTAIS